MPWSEIVNELSGSESDLEEPSKKKRRVSSGPSAKQKLSDEVFTRLLVAKPCPHCKSACLNQFQPPTKFEKFLEYRRLWSQTHKLDQDVVASWFYLINFAQFLQG